MALNISFKSLKFNSEYLVVSIPINYIIFLILINNINEKIIITEIIIKE